MSTKHSIAAQQFLSDQEQSQWHNQSIWYARAKRDTMAKGLPEWEQLRDLSSAIKRHTVTHLDYSLEEFARHAEQNGVIVHWAKDAKEHNEIVYDILQKHHVKKLVKSKSMLTEECRLNDFLFSKGIDVVETDLGERILQLMKIAPSHIVMPADAGMTGGNFGVAATGDVVVCTNEGNADMSTSMPKLHIASIGLEKIIPDYQCLSVFQRLLARSATGQPTTTYTSHFRKARPGAEMHIVLVDNGRSDILGNADHWETLKCLRCGACMNTCPVYRRSGGYSYTYFIPGPIGINLGMLRNPEEYSDNVSACSLCCSCDNVCPAKVNLSEQIYRWRQTLDSVGKADPMKKMMSKGMSYLFNHPSIYQTGLKFAPIVNRMPRFITYNGINAWGRGRELPTFAKESFEQMWKKGKVK